MPRSTSSRLTASITAEVSTGAMLVKTRIGSPRSRSTSLRSALMANSRAGLSRWMSSMVRASLSGSLRMITCSPTDPWMCAEVSRNNKVKGRFSRGTCDQYFACASTSEMPAASWKAPLKLLSVCETIWMISGEAPGR